MKKTYRLEQIFDRPHDWQVGPDGWDEVPRDVTSLFVNRTVAKTLAPLRNFRRLRRLTVYSVRRQDLEHVAPLSQLKMLTAGDVDADDLRWMQAMRGLESLAIRHGAKLKSLAGLEALQKLRHFYCYHIPNVHSLDPIQHLSNLEELGIEMSMGTSKRLTFDSLQPLANLPRLTRVELRGVRVADQSLAPLATLPRLRHLFPCSLDVEIGELAFLAAKLNRQLAKESRITPTQESPNLLREWHCPKCEAPRVVLMGRVGPRYRLLACKQCDRDLIASRQAIFDAARRSA